MAATQVNIRMDDALKQAGDEVLGRYGFSATQAIRALWEHVAHSGEVPDFMLSAEPDAGECARKLALIEGGRGAALRGAREAGIACTLPGESNEELLAAAYAERFGFLAEEA